ncbi:GATA transcription factor 5-like [Benincasa hispida]|uniref:GATA transcription factor 5-like n=1 Tax=Benincasa hispida TaxID=102211 RepID=UPI0018FF1A4C|nr:GATA transcription factor 5-like [Benincasa hispida]
MLYRTHHPFLFPKQTLSFLLPSLSLFHPLLCNNYSLLSFFPSPSPPVFRTMECVELSPQLCFHDNACFNPQNVVSSDDFFVDQLLDLSDHDEFLQDQTPDHHDHDKPSVSLSNFVSPQEIHHHSSVSDLPSLPSSELTVPADDLADLEWLSHFVEDSFSGFSAPFPSPGVSSLMKSSKEAAVVEEQLETDCSVSPPEPCFKTPIPVKARSKRTRPSGRVWCLGSPSLTESSSCSTTSSSSSSPASPWFIIPDRFEPEIPVSKKRRKKSPSEKSRTTTGVQQPRRCSHCGVQKTPQWRTGPLGAKTLCNACGVRFKSGRLLPEYRPACSPTFSSELHSNHHRKVLEMRRKKEVAAPAEFLTVGES